jgi:hypothetical protein
MNMLGAIFNKQYSLKTFKYRLDNFGVVLKGKSIEKLGEVSNEFNNCFIVNNFDEEAKLIGDSLEGNNIVHFANQSLTAPLRIENYLRFNIREVQLYKPCPLRDLRLLRILAIYHTLGLKVVFLPKHLLDVSAGLFGSEYKKKFPSTGLMAIYYALEIIKPKNLWIVGLDFYQSDYLVRRDYNTPIKIMRDKMKRIDASGVLNTWIKKYHYINFNIVTYFNGFKSRKNLTLL